MSNALVATKVDTTSPFSGAFLLSDTDSLVSSINSKSWVNAAVAGVSLALDTAAAVIDPIGTLIANGLGWLIDHLEPIKGWFDQLTGDADQVMAFSRTWANVGARMHDVAAQTQHRLVDLDGMSGASIDAYRAYIKDAAQHLKMTGDWAGAMSTGLQIASTIVSAVHGLVRDVLSQLVGSIISAVLEAVATVGFGLPEIIAQLATRVASLAAKLGETITGLIDTFRNLKNLLHPLQELIQRAHSLFAALPPGKSSTSEIASLVSEVPTVVFSRSRAPGIAENFDRAVAEGAPTRLTRTTREQKLLNREAALSGHDPAPPGQSLDEYPFASTEQGGAGSRVQAVPVPEQNYQGGVLSGFYSRHGIKAGDDFNVAFGE